MVAEKLGKFAWEVKEYMSMDELLGWKEYFAWVKAERKRMASQNR